MGGILTSRMGEKTMKTFSAVLALAALASACAPAERSRDLGDSAVPAIALAQQVCSACHGVAGISTSPKFPHLAGQPASYLVMQLQAFRDHRRSDPAAIEYMWGMSRHLTDRQIRDLAAYYAAQQAVVPVSANESAKSNGRMIVEGGIPGKEVPSCASCHGPNGQGNSLAPRLAGQHADYLAKQLNVYRHSNNRPDSAPMQAVARGLSDEDMRAVSAYLASISAPPAASPDLVSAVSAQMK